MKRLLEKIREILRNRHNRRTWARIISAIACLVVFFSTYALILPAITMEKTAYCGIEAHQHDDSCYTEELICTFPESDGHVHDDSCYTTRDELVCQLEEHIHDDNCYDEDGNLICGLTAHVHDDSCWQEVTELTCGLEESQGHHHTDACYEKVLTCGKEAHTHSKACYEPNSGEAAGTAATNAQGVMVGGSTDDVDVSTGGATDPAAAGLTTGAAADPDAYVQTLDELDFNQILNRNTGIYYYHADTAGEVAENQEDAGQTGEQATGQSTSQTMDQSDDHAADQPGEINSADIPADAWQKVNKKTVLGENDILRVYFSYTIPAGSLNETNDTARYRLPANLHISDDQIETINKTENGIAAAFIDYNTLAITDPDAYNRYLGVEAVEGTRKPGELPAADAQEYISAVVRVQNVYDTEGLYGKKDAFLGQDLVFTFVPYTVQKNQNTYDAQGNPTSAGQTVKGWFTMDLTPDQIDFQPSADSFIDSSSDSSDPTPRTREAEIVFVEEYKDPAQGIAIDEISTKLVLEDVSGKGLKEQEDSAEDTDDPENADNPEQAENADDADSSGPDGEADGSDESDKEASAEDDADVSDSDEAKYPAQSFKDSITVRMGSLSTDANAAGTTNTGGSTSTSAAAPEIQDRTELTVSVEAEEGTFPEGTTMHLAAVTGTDLDTVAEAVEGAVESQTAGFHAVDITFHDADGNEIEPRKPIKVSMQSESIRQAVENPSTAPVVVHVEDNKKENEKGYLAGNENVNGDGSEADRKSEITAETDSYFSSSSNIGLDSANVTGTTVPGSAEEDNLTFESDTFSVYAIVYTVDFHYEVNGKMYEFSIPGGGFVSLEHVVEVLGIARIGENSGSKDENQANEVENASESDVYNVEEATGVEDNDANSSNYEESISLNNVEISETTKKFVADVASVEFSSPELVWAGKADSDTTVGGLKEANGLEVQYSAELTEEQIAEINSSTVEAGDWALISMQPFTSNETLTVTMKNGDRFVVRVTDGQRITDYSSIVPGREYIIYVVKDGNQYYALRNNGNSEYVGSSEADLEKLGSSYIWNYGVDPTACWWYSGYRYLNVDNSSDTRTVVGNQRDYLFMTADDRGGFDIYGYNDGGKHLSWDTSGFKITNKKDVSIKVYMKDKKQFDFTVAVNNDNYGSVSCVQTITNENKTNKTDIVATVKDGCFFSGWRLGDEILTGYGQTIRAGTLQFPEDNMRLTALFGKNYTSQATQEINEWVDGLLGNPILSDKTAHVYDYDNRIYEVDISASSMRYTINSGLTLEFITDASRSMYFPAQVTPVTKNNQNISSYKYNGVINLGQWLSEHGVPGETYFVVSDVGKTATMYAVYWGKQQYDSNGSGHVRGEEYGDDQWVYTDASYYNAPDGAKRGAFAVSGITNGQVGNNNYLLNGTIYSAPVKENGKDWNRLDYLRSALLAATRALYRLDPSAQIGLITFANEVLDQPKDSGVYRISAGANNESTITNAINGIWTSGGTNQQAALNFYWKSDAARKDLTVFTSTSTRKQVAILITDGAPNQSSINWTTIGNSASNLRARNVDLYTLGLSLNDVGETNKNGLNGIAGTPAGTDLSYAFQAEKGEEFAGEIEKMLLKILDKATLVGQVTDTIDPAFYPVDNNGNPISSGTTVTQSDGKRATYVENADGSWTVTYNNAEISWPAVDTDNNPILDAKGNVETPGWKTSIYIKAKEDFMGGNKISTNTGLNDQVTATGYKQTTAPNGVRSFETPFVKLLSVPYVNVDELSLTENSTEWRVYLGTDVDPEEELLKLWNEIQVNQVVKDNGIADEIIRISNGNQMYYNDARDNDNLAPNGTTNETLPLSHFVNSEILTGLIRQLDNEETTAVANLTYRYFPYGHDVVGNFDIELTKTVNEDAAVDHAPTLHTTKEVGEDKEVYTLKVIYNPMTDGASTDYGKTTTNGKTAAKVADGYDSTTGNKIESENTHKIHVFAKDLEIQKKDMTNTSKLIDTAKFRLYRTAKNVIDPETGQETSQYEAGTVDLNVGNEMKKVVQIGDEMTTSGGKITVEDLSYAPNGVYYLEETKAPDGYIIGGTPITIRLTLNDVYTDYKSPFGTITNVSNTPYNWTQTVNRLIYSDSKNGTGDADKFIVEVLNNPGVELPATGGPGTTLLYLLGILLTGVAGTGLVIKRRRRAA